MELGNFLFTSHTWIIKNRFQMFTQNNTDCDDFSISSKVKPLVTLVELTRKKMEVANFLSRCGFFFFKKSYPLSTDTLNFSPDTIQAVF